MPELEVELTALATSIEWPPTPRVRVSYFPVYAEMLPARQPRGITRWALAAAAALLIVATLLAYTPTRDAIAGWLNLHTNIQRQKNPATPSPPPPGQLGSNLDLGTPMTLADARGQVSWKITAPSSLGRPDAVYVKLPPAGPSKGEVTLVYASASGVKVSGQTGVAVLVTEARGSVNEIYFQKTLGPEAQVEQVTIQGHSGYWISGHPHDFLFVGADGKVQDDSLRLATNTLILDFGGTIVRIEGDMTKDQALAIAASIT